MKNKITILMLFIIIASCKAQSILPIEKVIDYRNSKTGIPQNITQIKDVNGLLNKFIGVWKGTYNNKNYEFRIVKHIRQSNTRSLSKEELLIRYKITDNTNTTIEDTTTLPNDSYYVIEGQYLAKTGAYVLYYQGKHYKCGQNGDIFISVDRNNSTKMGLQLIVYGQMYNDECPNGAANQILPTGTGIELTKQ